MTKRIFDIVFSFFGLVLLIPIMILISLSIKISCKGSIFFVQDRVGQYGTIFRMIKFRSMHIGSDQSNSISVKGDLRVTYIGSFLRKFKLDELPELWNVFIGDMSFVGPRPDIPGYADSLVGENRKILDLKPGITGPASLKYANEEEILMNKKNPKEYNDKIIYPDKVKINLDYYYNYSLWLDIKIIFATIFRIVKF